MKAKLWRSLQGVMIVAGTSLLVAVAYTSSQYLRTSPRFDVNKVLVLGSKRVTETQVLGQADVPDQANVFSVDLAAIRERVERMAWVRYAIVQRVFPDTITIKIFEREPVGLARLRGRVYQFDADGAILDYDPGTGVNYPILDGLQTKDSEGNVRRAELYVRVLRELQSQSELSEVHINQDDEVSVVLSGEPIVVNLGVGDFHARWIRYLELKSQIQERYPDAVQVDFRFQNQVILKMRTDAPADEKVIWDVEKKSL